jgi:hemin uptake protein HemP
MAAVNRAPCLLRLRIANDPETPRMESCAEKVTASRPRVDSQTLFANSRTLVIHHEGSNYLLRITNQGKLILTK